MIRGRAIPQFIVPLSIVTINATIWTILIKIPFKESFEVDSEPWASIYTLVLTTALAFLLVFRLNRVAIRWWDCRQMWGIIVANVRILANGILEYTNHAPHCRDDAISWLAGYLISVKQHIRHDKSYDDDELAGFLSKAQVDALAAAAHPCLYATSEIRHALKMAFTVTADTPAGLGASHSSDMRLMDKSLHILIDNMGGLERVRSTPLPIAFITHLRTFIMFYLLSLPYLYGHTWGWGTIPAVFLTAYALLGIDGAASECESPFEKRANHLYQEGFCLTAMNDIEQLVIHNDNMQRRRSPE